MVFDLDLSEEQSALVGVVSDLAANVLDPAARAAEADATVPATVWARLLELGVTNPVAVEHGGGGIPDAVSWLMAVEGLAHGDPGIAAAATWSGNAALLIGACGTAAQRTTHLPLFVAEVDRRGACAHHEGFGRAPSEYATTFTRTPGGWRVAGRKVAVTFVGEADPLVVVGVDAADGRLRAAIVPPSAAGVDRQPGSVGHLGLDAARIGAVELDVEVGEADLVGGPDADPDLLGRVLARLRLSTAALALGTARRAREHASAYAVERIAFAKPIAAFQGVSFMMAEAEMQIAAARLELWDAAVSLDRAGIGDLERAVSLAVNYANAVACSVTRDAVQVLGGHGFIEDHPVERWYRCAAALSAVDFDPTCVPFAAAL